MAERALVGNAADKEQVGKAGHKLKLRQQQDLSDMRAVLATREGRRVLWRLLETCKVFGSVWHPSALIHFNAGQQDVGHLILAKITEANDEALLLMMREAKQEAEPDGGNDERRSGDNRTAGDDNTT